eukprot:CAMPEP_0179303262 /NCGR_PEP_ID=MMETSP0797-20121207/48489_1 /TAXON_ID=47934 /ORGANISM="Dinophysis acuminata, Strain DAEP01" /LENGTH=149 /DNA_ID=CAMNT_0021012817 /DNA_START=33 /DNA_END=478 /DNA_ORIENTATION=+
MSASSGTRLQYCAEAHTAAPGLLEDVQRDLAHELAHPLGLLEVLLRNVGVARVGRVVLAVGREALRDAYAGAVELPDDPLLILRLRALGRGVDEIAGPPQRDRLLGQAERWHDFLEVPLEEALGQVHEQGLVRSVVGVDGAGAADGGDA